MIFCSKAEVWLTQRHLVSVGGDQGMSGLLGAAAWNSVCYVFYPPSLNKTVTFVLLNGSKTKYIKLVLCNIFSIIKNKRVHANRLCAKRASADPAILVTVYEY